MKVKTSIALALLSILLLLSYKTYKEKKRDTKREFMLKILPNEKILQNFSYTGIGLLHGHACSCEDKSTVIKLKDRLNKEDGTIKARRDKELKHFKKRYGSVNNNVLIAPLNLPLSYPIHGTQVMPLHTIFLRGLSVYEEGNQNYEVTLEASLGTFNTFADVPEEQVEGRGKNKMTISTPYLQVLNHILQHVTYTSTVFDIDATDIVHFKMGNHKASFPVMIKQPPMPFLFDSGPDQKISSLVTITTKTFLRYDKVRLLIKSIREFYPNITIIVADDNENTEKIEEPNVEQYFMPYAKGWFAGRNLAVSQVTTKYFLWVDDDFLFTKDTKIEKLVQVLEETDLDLVGGSVDNTAFKFRIVYQEGDEEGDCLYRRDGYYHNLEGFPNCVVASGVVNFFMAHARRVLAAGFDPKLNRVAHSEFFVDAFGSLRVGSCSDVVAGHQQRTPAQTDNEKKYVVFRQDTHEQINFKMNLLYFKHNLKCYTYK